MNELPHNVLPAHPVAAGPAPGTPAAAILAAARRLFAEQGYAGTSTRGIAELADVNLAMIHYYFGNKEQLYRYVMEQELAELFRIMRESLESDIPPREVLAALPGFILDVHQQRPGLIRLMLREMNDGAPTLPGVIKDLGEHGPLGLRQTLYGIIDALQVEGFAADLPPAHLLALFFGLSHGMMAFAPLIEAVTALDLQDPNTASALGRSAETFVRRALEPNKETR